MTAFTGPFQLPKPNYFNLENGCMCVLAALPQAELTCFDFWCKAGSAFEDSGEEGLAHFLEHMLFKGSTNLRAGDFDQKIEALGGSSNAATGFDDVHYYVLVPNKHSLKAVKLLLNLVLEPSFNVNDFNIEREVVLEEIAQYKDQPDEVAFQTLLELCWGDHPYGRPILGVEKSLNESNPQKMKKFHKKLYQPNNYCLAISGSIPEDLKGYLSKQLPKKKESISKSISKKEYKSQLTFKGGRTIIKLPRLESARVLMAWPIPCAHEQLLISGIDIAISMLAEGRNSILVRTIREELQIVEAIDMDIIVLEQGGLIILEAFCLEENIGIVENEINRILIKTIRNKPNEEEILRAKKLVNNGIYFGLETSKQIANSIGSKGLWDRKDSLETQFEYINYWDSSKIHNEISKFINPNLSHTLIAIPSEKNCILK